jgi:hypothetical protein
MPQACGTVWQAVKELIGGLQRNKKGKKKRMRAANGKMGTSAEEGAEVFEAHFKALCERKPECGLVVALQEPQRQEGSGGSETPSVSTGGHWPSIHSTPSLNPPGVSTPHLLVTASRSAERGGVGGGGGLIAVWVGFYKNVGLHLLSKSLLVF